MRLVLYQPDIPQNAGTILRLAACLGIGVDIVEPCGFVWSEPRLRRAGMDYLEFAAVARHTSWQAFLDARAPGRLVLLTTRGATPLPRTRFAPDDYLVLGREVSPAFNGGALVHAEYQGFTLANSSDEIVLRRPGGRLVDRVAYDSSAGWPGAPGASAELAQGRLGSTWNDDPAMWCTATSRMTGGDLGSPGVGNGPCP